MCRLFLVIFALISYNASAFDLDQHRKFSALVLPDNRVIYGVLDVQTGRAGFAVCELKVGRPENCQSNPRERFLFKDMAQVKQRFAQVLGPKKQSAEEAGHELGLIAGLRLSPGQVALYYGFKRAFGSGGLPGGVIQHYSRLFNSNLNSPPTLSFDAAGGAITPSQLLEALQFAASGQE